MLAVLLAKSTSPVYGPANLTDRGTDGSAFGNSVLYQP